MSARKFAEDARKGKKLVELFPPKTQKAMSNAVDIHSPRKIYAAPIKTKDSSQTNRFSTQQVDENIKSNYSMDMITKQKNKKKVLFVSTPVTSNSKFLTKKS